MAVCGAKVGKFVLFEMSPNVFGWVKFGRIGWQVFELNASTLFGDPVFDQTTSMDRSPIPDQGQGTGNLTQQRFKKLDDLLAFDASINDLKIEIQERNTGNDRDAFPVEVVLKHGGLTSWRPGSNSMGFLTQSTFIKKDDYTSLTDRFFLMSGQVLRFHRRIFHSSLSNARPTGRWQLQPNL